MRLVDSLMVLLFPFLDSLPFTLPRYWLFRDRLRIPLRFVVLLQVLLASLNSAVFYLINLDGYAAAARWTTLIRYAFLLVYMALSFALIRDSFPKLMFTYLLLLSWSFFVYGNANYVESRFFWDFSDRHPYLCLLYTSSTAAFPTHGITVRWASNSRTTSSARDGRSSCRRTGTTPAWTARSS